MDSLLVLALLCPPLLAGLLALAPLRAASAASVVNAVTIPISLASAAAIAVRLARGGEPVEAGAFWRLDSLSALMALLVSLLATLAIWTGPGLRRHATEVAREVRTYRIYINLFAFTMLVAVSTGNLGLMWVAIEATTVTSALLIPMRRTRAAANASWKYLLIGSVGIALAFTGTVLAFVDYAASGGSIEQALQWTTLRASASSLHPEVAQLAFVFLLVGFGTKAGLVPTHTWLPEAHSEAPAPLSALMSGVLLAVALYAIARWKGVVDLTVGSSFSSTLLLVVGVATIAVGSLSLLAQTHYKRLLAYSSIEHMGLACVGLALGPAGTFAALLHLTNHALAKGTAFFLSGRVLERFKTVVIADVPALLTSAPLTGAVFAGSIAALAGLPPFGLFVTEILIVKTAWASGHHAVTAAVLILLLTAFAALAVHLQRMLFGGAASVVVARERPSAALILLALPVVGVAWLGISLPPALHLLIGRAAALVQP